MMKLTELRAPRRGSRSGAKGEHELDVADRQNETGSEYADNRVLLAIEPDGAAEHGGVAAKSTDPERFGQDHDLVGTRPLVGRLQQTPDPRRGADDLEEIAGRPNSLGTLGRR